MIVHPEQECLSHRRCLLADRKVSRSLVVILDSFIRALRLYALEHTLELADQEHILVHSYQGISPVGFLFLVYILLVLVKRDLGKGKTSGFAFFCRFNDL